MGNVVSNTADILAILGGATTLIIGIFGAIRLSRCQTVRCCWGCVDLINRPLGDAKQPAHPPGGGAKPLAGVVISDSPTTATTSATSATFPSSASLSTLTPSNSDGFISPIAV